MKRRALGAIAALAILSIPAAAFLPPAGAILKRAAQRRSEAFPSPIEARGAITFFGAAAREAAAAARSSAQGAELSLPAVVLLKAPARCRLELAEGASPPAERPAASLKGGRLAGQLGLEKVAPVRALLEGLCALLGEKGSGEALSRALSAHGVDLSQVSLGRLDQRVAWVIGGRPGEPKPQAWVDKQQLQLTRLVAPLAGATRDVRLLELGSSPGGDAFPRTIEVWSGDQLEARFTAEKVTPSPKMADARF